jgi:hypothetical protein
LTRCDGRTTNGGGRPAEMGEVVTASAGAAGLGGPYGAGGERRACQRISEPPVTLQGPVRAAVQDMSLGGICLRIERPLPAGQCFRLLVGDEPSHQECALQAEVMWCAGGRAGLRWVDLSGDQQRWLRELFRGWRSEACAARLGAALVRLGGFVLYPAAEAAAEAR